MPARHPMPLPRLWLFTDERQGDALFPAVERLPRGAGMIFRHYSLGEADRAALFARLRRLTRLRGVVILWAGRVEDALRHGADGVHGWSRSRTHRPLLRTAPVHDRRQLIRAQRMGVDAVFLSPVFATRSHPGARPLGRSRFGLVAEGATIPVVALGGVRRDPHLPGSWGYAAIDGLTPGVGGQKRNAVPR
ncbi:thiamine-phosphate pyrophosphorylase [Sphingomonas jejuensis]|uniref:Thiamine-phosphate pyrophosphorylase n=1 Tax=Sphingomonas jejuensis TaxID=904715 RepID=A0ABX0XQP0_9SPHN|nr:thiamine phosphate synthase [Sphingomonas jejuensis]NJC35027.1 thiamine-phosphate pyrophosphorylase [Sphingomonas jejuensis]